jgi:hypothetical protein
MFASRPRGSGSCCEFLPRPVAEVVRASHTVSPDRQVAHVVAHLGLGAAPEVLVLPGRHISHKGSSAAVQRLCGHGDRLGALGAPI